MTQNTTLRAQLNNLRFDWPSGEILDKDHEGVSHDDPRLDEPFYPGYGSSEAPPIMAWDKTHVYFLVVYDGAEWMERVPRDPRSIRENDTIGHVGGE